MISQRELTCDFTSRFERATYNVLTSWTMDKYEAFKAIKVVVVDEKLQDAQDAAKERHVAGSAAYQQAYEREILEALKAMTDKVTPMIHDLRALVSSDLARSKKELDDQRAAEVLEC